MSVTEQLSISIPLHLSDLLTLFLLVVTLGLGLYKGLISFNRGFFGESEYLYSSFSL